MSKGASVGATDASVGAGASVGATGASVGAEVGAGASVGATGASVGAEVGAGSRSGEQRPTPFFPQISSQMFERSTFLLAFTCFTLEAHNCLLQTFPYLSKYTHFLFLGLLPIVNLARLSLH